MSLSGFLKFVEIQTKVASVIPFILGTLYSLYRYETFNFENFITMFISLITFDMATTAINNYCDYKKAHTNEGYDYKVKNAIEKYNIRQSTAVFIIFTLLIIATAAGITLTLNTNVVVLFIGIVSFIAGILYTFGPIPISRMPLGEVFSGIFMGFLITFLSIYIHIYNENIVTIMYQSNILKINTNIFEVFYIFLVCIPSINGIANIMLANNICDVEEDVINKRFTLPYYIGKKSALKLFKVLYYISYLDIIILVILSILPVTSLLTLFTLIPINKNIKLFYSQPVKSKTFVLAVKNFALINLTYITSILIMTVVNYL
ncbi:1,4-dihydroxy-2-naphthoate octaprenyltransferase [Clostridium pascui]|uniref:1,4-dihydroxy-2-naphthoate polyprenyltransferase n=1 Tax=Clostridium pascui TaxID=46609 RepID=UPI0019589AFB|nr:1,4-dihydroxy-2-naphthoate polyprenyltransferase [Clostridium pascui]MBM7870844.1 1,4-dihydroxy-2-naphthoate octaprenyltransferase [Clostridium pascui]